MALYNLAKRIAKWLWENGDIYEMKDSDIYSYEDMETKTTIGLSTTPKAVRDYLETVECPLYKEVRI